MTRCDAVNYIKTRRVEEERAHASFVGLAFRRNKRERMQSTNQDYSCDPLRPSDYGENTEIDPVRNIVELYERILAQLRSGGHGGLL